MQIGRAQSTPQEEAAQLFESGKYAEALPVFKRLITLFPKDPKYQYFAGICMVQSNTGLPKAIDYLKFAAEKSVPRDVYFFLGKASHLLYRFDDALDYYLKFQQFGERSEKEKWQCDMHINMARNGKRLLEKKVVFDVYSIDSVSNDHVFEYYNKWLRNGKFKEKPMKTVFLDSKETTWTYIPSMLMKDQKIYQTTMGLRKNKDLFILRKLDDDNWSRPENPGNNINSPYDEDYAFFNENESALYFSSKGHNSMGGYDIFKSVYNPDSKTWSEPVNLGYPFNSPYDDFLFVPGDDQSKALFASNRETHGESVKIYMVSFSKTYATEDKSADENPLNPFKLKEMTQTKVQTNSSSPVNSNLPKTEKKQENSIPIKTVKVIKPEPESEPYPDELARDKDYNELLRLALHYQIESDSASRAAEEIRQQLPSVSNETEISKLKRNIYLLDQQSKTNQVKADELYEKARKFEVLYTEKKESSDSPKLTDEMAKKAFSSKKEKTTTAPDQKKKDIPYEFRIMSKSPYKSVSDIPLDRPAITGLLYRIQMGAFSKPIEADKFGGIVPICAETVQNTTIIKYYAGIFTHMSDAEKALIKIREYGFKDAYIVSFYNGKSIPINRAKEIEKEDQ